MRKNKVKKMMAEGKSVINGWLSIPSTASAETMAHQGWDSVTIDMQHGQNDYHLSLCFKQSLIVKQFLLQEFLGMNPVL